MVPGQGGNEDEEGMIRFLRQGMKKPIGNLNSKEPMVVGRGT